VATLIGFIIMIIYAKSGAYNALTVLPPSPFDALLVLLLPLSVGLLSRESLERISDLSSGVTDAVTEMLSPQRDEHTFDPRKLPATVEDASSIREQWKDSIVLIRTISSKLDGTQPREHTGTGFVISKAGHIITAAHVASKVENQEFQVSYYASPGPNVSTRWNIQCIHREDGLDIALLKLPHEAQHLQPIPISSSSNVPNDTELFMLGFPKNQPLSFVNGHLSNRDGPGGRIQTTLPMNPGVSGSPVFNNSNAHLARVIGIAVGGLGEAQGMNYVIPSEYLSSLLNIAGVRISEE
jgi:S1-C subfamily serine protease